MFKTILSLIFGTYQDRQVKKLMKLVNKVNSIESQIESLSDDQLKAQTEKFREQLANGATLDDIIVEAFATVREAAKRQLGMRHYDVQLLGGYALYRGNIAEMKTGEGKTLVATLPIYLHALSGKGAHLVTANDYLAKRDAVWMSKVYKFLGMSVGIIQGNNSFVVEYDEKGNTIATPCERKAAYYADITYGTNNEYGFDYLRDNMKYDINEYCQRELNFAIVDEVDSILIDEARTPLIISGQAESNFELYYAVNKLCSTFEENVHYTKNEKNKSVQLTHEGIEAAQKFFNADNIYEVEHVEKLHYIDNSIKAYALYHRDIEYIVQDGKVVIVDEFTGRLMEGRRFGDGLHQAIEAKEGLKIENENQTLASITFQNFFRMYNKLSGMTGTAITEALEFQQIYGLDTIVIPTHLKISRIDYTDSIYKTTKAKYDAVVEDIIEKHELGRPVLVGTVSIENSEYISSLLKKHNIQHEILNAKNHAKEALIVENAGAYKAVTIATNMAGRGTDIKLGEGVREIGGLHIIGTERHESRRIDNQLRGRAGRQGDPGSSKFYLSLEDSLLRIFGAETVTKIMDTLKIPENEAIEHPMVTRSITTAQKKIENYNLEIRKHLNEYDTVNNMQRKVIYTLRKDVLTAVGSASLNADGTISGTLDNSSDDGNNNSENPSLIKKNQIYQIVMEFASGVLGNTLNVDSNDLDWRAKVSDSLGAIFGIQVDTADISKQSLTAKRDEYFAEIQSKIDEKIVGLGPVAYLVFKHLILTIIDTLWREHLRKLDHLRQSVMLRGYGQKDPLIEYKKEAFQAFTDMMNKVERDVIHYCLNVQIRSNEEMMAIDEQERNRKIAGVERHDSFSEQAANSGQSSQHQHNQGEQAPKTQPVRVGIKVGRNDPCPCGSGKKYKSCHGKEE